MKTDRSDLEVTSAKMNFEPVRENIKRIMNDYPGNMEILCYSNGVRFDLSDGIYHLEVAYLYTDVSSDFEETANYFWVAPRWMCEFYRYPA